MVLTEGSDYQIQLVDVWRARPQGSPDEQLAEYAADGPDVDWSAILGVADEQFGRPVPSRGHVIREIGPWA